MNKLIPFESNHLQKFELWADLLVDETDPSKLRLQFQVRDPLDEVSLEPREYRFDETSMVRKDELWKMTCFEMFLNPVGQKQYYEFNFNLEGAWNNYHFAGYRFPQPPQANSDFLVSSLIWKPKDLTVQIQNKSPFRHFNVGLTAVIKDKKNQTTYFSLQHEGGKPDFHTASGFILQRG